MRDSCFRGEYANYLQTRYKFLLDLNIRYQGNDSPKGFGALGELVLAEKVVLQQEPRQEILPRLLKAKTTLFDIVKIKNRCIEHAP